MERSALAQRHELTENYLTVVNVSMHKTNIPPAVNTQGGCILIIIKGISFFVLSDASYQFKFILQSYVESGSLAVFSFI
jgi:hypothetical protein